MVSMVHPILVEVELLIKLVGGIVVAELHVVGFVVALVEQQGNSMSYGEEEAVVIIFRR